MQYLIISGERRSGTTFLANFLNSQHNVTIYHDMFRSLFVEGKKLNITNIHAQLSEEQINIISSNLEAEAISIGHKFKVNRTLVTSWYDIFKLALISLKKKNDLIVGSKITSENYYANKLISNNVKYIYIVRDPRDVFISSKNRFSNFNINDFVFYWKKSTNMILNYKDHENVLLIKFEDLISNKENTLDIVEKFLQIEIDSTISKIKSRNQHDFVENSSFGDIVKPFDANALYRWTKKAMSPEIKLISFICRKELKRIKYKLLNIYTFSFIVLILKYYIYILKQYLKKCIKKILF